MLQYADEFNRICMTYNVNALNNKNKLNFKFWSQMNIYVNEDEDILMLLYKILTFLA